MAKHSGWWTLSLDGNGISELSDADLEHITQSIKDGYSNGEIVKEESD